MKLNLPRLSFKQKGFKSQLRTITRLSRQNSKEYIKALLQARKRLNKDDLMVGNLIWTSYNAKDKTQPWDKKPMFLVLSRSRGYTLGLNWHWLPVSMRVKLLQLILQINKNKRKDEVFSIRYKELKPLLKKLGYYPCIRLYINKRLGRNCVNIPHEQFPSCAVLDTALFTGIQPEKIYKSIKQKVKK